MRREKAPLVREKVVVRGKTRTREHILADLAVNHLERHVLLCGHTAERVRHDYGYDLTISTYDERGRIEGGTIFVQVKATDRLPLLKDGRTITWPVSRRDLKLWLSEAYPMILVVYDGQKDRASWLDVLAYFADYPTSELFAAGETLNVHVPIANRVNRRAIRAFVRRKNEVQQRIHAKGRDDV